MRCLHIQCTAAAERSKIEKTKEGIGKNYGLNAPHLRETGMAFPVPSRRSAGTIIPWIPAAQSLRNREFVSARRFTIRMQSRKIMFLYAVLL